MISQANIKWISDLSGVSVEEISGALSKEDEVSLGLRLSGRVISQEEEKNLKTTLTDAGIEIGYKKIAKSAKIELESGEKDPDIIAGKINIGITNTLEEKYKGQTPSDELKSSQTKVKELEDINTKLLQTYEQSKTDLEQSKTDYSGLKNEIKITSINNDVMKWFPEKMKQDKNDALLIATNAFEFGEREIEGKMVEVTIDKSTNSIITDPVGKPEKRENVIKSFIETKGWVKGNGMNGNDRDNKSGLPTGMTDDAAMKYITESGKDPMSSEGSQMFTELTKSA